MEGTMSKYKQVLPFFWLLFVCPSHPQADNQIDKNDIYAIGLMSGLEAMSKEYSHIDMGIPGQRQRIDYKHIIVRMDYITGRFSSILKSDKYKIEYLNDKQLIERYKKVKLEYPVLMIQPAEVEGNRLAVTLTLYWMSYKKGNLQFGLSDSCTTYFRFDCEKREFILDEVKLGGMERKTWTPRAPG
jgi:hypothetical protein